MSTKMKGLLKGLRYISQIFDDEKEPEMQIGFPTDVKHVAHIGWDGPSVNTPSWMNNFRSTPEFSSAAALGTAGDAKENPAVKWVSEASRREARAQNSPARDLPELPRSSRRQSLNDTSLSAGSPSREKSDKPKHSRRQQSTGVLINSPARQLQVSSLGIESPTLPDIPKKSRRKKSKESSAGGSTRLSRSKGTTSSSTFASPLLDPRSKGDISSTYASPFSDPGPGSGSNYKNNELYQTSTLHPFE